jgi:hypothetical protein
MTEEQLKAIEAHADNEQWQRGDEGGDYPSYGKWCEPMQDNIHLLVAEVRKLQRERDEARKTALEEAAVAVENAAIVIGRHWGSLEGQRITIGPEVSGVIRALAGSKTE